MSDQGRAGPALVDPGLVHPKRGIGNRRPARTQAQVGKSGSPRSLRVVPVPPHHNLRARSVVGQEKNQRILPLAHLPDLLEHPPDPLVHGIHHRGMSRHLVGLKSLLNIRQFVPRIGILDLPLAQDLVSIRKIIRRSHLALDLGEFTEPKAQFLLPGMALGPHLIPTRPVALAVTLDIRRLGMKRKMGSGEGEKMHERALRMLLFMLARDLHRMIGNRIGHVKSSLTSVGPCLTPSR